MCVSRPVSQDKMANYENIIVGSCCPVEKSYIAEPFMHFSVQAWNLAQLLFIKVFGLNLDKEAFEISHKFKMATTLKMAN